MRIVFLILILSFNASVLLVSRVNGRSHGKALSYIKKVCKYDIHKYISRVIFSQVSPPKATE